MNLWQKRVIKDSANAVGHQMMLWNNHKSDKQGIHYMVLMTSPRVCNIPVGKARALDDLWQCNYMLHKPQTDKTQQSTHTYKNRDQ